MLKEGDKIPKFKLKNADDKIISSEDYMGKRLVIYFYPKDFTPGCTKEADGFSSKYPEFEKLNVDIIGVSKDSASMHKKFSDKKNIPYTLLSDPDATLAKSFGVWGKKKFMGVEYTGMMRTTFLIAEDGLIFKAYPKVKVSEHIEQVLNEWKIKKIVKI
ncbi:MAG: thioredoxin-dependent thiol peroxidase [Candidatus Nitrosoabyssus spongiisocia]|nr:MAG: thioredoxin-dependent thiol peroxidase [Nitrosopumilaceae archaeon AB1(1)]